MSLSVVGKSEFYFLDKTVVVVETCKILLSILLKKEAVIVKETF